MSACRGLPGTNHFYARFGLTKATNDETPDLNATVENDRV